MAKRKKVLMTNGQVMVFGHRRKKPKILREGSGKKTLIQTGKTLKGVGKSLKEVLPSRSKFMKAKFALRGRKSIYKKEKKNKFLENFFRG